MLEGLRFYTIFCFALKTLCTLLSTTVFCIRSRSKMGAKTFDKELCQFHNNSPLLTTECFGLMFLATEMFPANMSLFVEL